MSVTIKTIAAETGLSISTVSRALAETGRIKTSTRAKVLAKAKELGYTPNEAAKTLITGRTKTIALIVPTVINPFFTAVLKGTQARARALGYILIVADSDEDPALERRLVAELTDRTDGLIVSVSPSPAAEEDAISYSERTPMVLLNREAPGVPYARLDMSGGARQSIEHLVALGHRRIAYIGGSDSSWMNHHQAALLIAEAAAAGVELKVLGPYATGPEGGAAALAPIRAAGITAVVAFNDLMAMGLIGQMSAQSLLCPEDLSVIGIDDIPYASMSTPRLSTIRVSPGRLGSAAVDVLVSIINEGHDARRTHVLQETELVVRDSTAPPRSV